MLVDLVIGGGGGDDREKIGKLLNDFVGRRDQELRMAIMVLWILDEKPAGTLTNPLDEPPIIGATQQRIDAMAKDVRDPSKAIFNLHCPPYKSGLDEAPAIDADLRLLHGGRALRPVGSTAVREAIERYQPLLSLHGHIHESKGAVKIGKTLSINPGSAYEEGMLMAAIINLDAQKGIKSYQLVNG